MESEERMRVIRRAKSSKPPRLSPPKIPYDLNGNMDITTEPPLENLCNEWIDQITRIVPRENEYYNLKPGITEVEIAEHRSLSADIHIPDDLLRFYQVMDVEYDSVASAFTFRSHDLIAFKDIAKEWQDINDLFGLDNPDDLDLSGYSDKVKAEGYANPRWIPIATSRDGDYLLYDTDPSEKGRYGQIIALSNESWTRVVVAESLTQLIQHEIDEIRRGNIEQFEFILEEDD